MFYAIHKQKKGLFTIIRLKLALIISPKTKGLFAIFRSKKRALKIVWWLSTAKSLVHISEKVDFFDLKVAEGSFRYL